jgi:thiol-disulfide isomerase/thioredoxin
MAEETKTIQLANKDFDIDMNLIKKGLNDKVLVVFFNPGCGHCVHFKPVYEQLAEMSKNGKLDTSIATVNTGDNRDLMQRINDPEMANKRDFLVQGVPTIVSYHNGQYFSNYAPGPKGSHPYRSLEDVIDYVSGIGSAEITYNK